MKMAIKMYPGFGWIETRGQNLGPFLVIRYINNYSYEKYVNNKSCFPIFISFNEEKNQKDSADF
jgi:hypothetical protein